MTATAGSPRPQAGPPDARPAPSALRREARSLLEISALCGFVFVQPLLDVMGRSPDFFVLRRAGAGEIVGLAIVVTFVPALVLWSVGLAGRAFGEVVRRRVHVVTLGILFLLLALQLLKKLLPLQGVPVVLVGLVLAVAAVVLVLRSAAVRAWLLYASPAPLVFGLLFLAVSPVSDLVRPSAAGETGLAAGIRTPVVVLFFDEFPAATLLDREGRVDARLFPNLAEFAATSTHYRNTTGVASFTPWAVPAMLTGRYPRDTAPHHSQYPDNLFSLLSTSHQVKASEVITALCAPSICEEGGTGTDIDEADVPDLVGDAARVWRDIVSPGETDDNPADSIVEETVAERRGTDAEDAPTDPKFLFGQAKPARFQTFLDGFERNEPPTLHFLHVLLPHQPWQILPSGRRYTDRDIGASDPGPVWTEEAWPTEVIRQRLLLQTVYTDALIGQVIDRLEETGLYDRALVVITADHGITMLPGEQPRGLSTDTAGDVMWVPLLVKAPQQHEGVVDDRNVEQIDLLPTISDLLGVRVPWKMDGVSAAGPVRRPTSEKTFLVDGMERREVDARDWLPVVLRGVAEEVAGTRPDLGPAGLYRMGALGELVGTAVAGLEVVEPAGGDVRIDDADGFADVDPAGKLPALLTGRVESLGATEDVAGVAIAVNGVVAGASEIYGSDRRIATMLDEAVFRPGRNEVAAYFVVERDGGTQLVPAGD